MSKRAPLSAQELRQLLAEHGGWSAAARATGINVSTIKTRASTLGVKAREDTAPAVEQPEPRQTIETGKETASAEFVEATITPDDVPTDAELLKRANLNPERWEVVSRRQSVWDAPSQDGPQTMRSLRVSYAVKRATLAEEIQPAFGGAPVTVKPPARRKRQASDIETVFVVSDFHCPYHDERLLERCEQLLTRVEPQRLIVNGDLVDWPTLSRHPKTTGNPAANASANECIQAGGEVLARLRAAVPEDCLVQFVPGNHDSNLARFLYQNASAAADLCVAGTDTPVWSLRNLLQFDRLGIEMVGDEEQWQHAVVRLTDHLVVRHGLSVRAGSAASVVANMKSSEYATVSGHTHRQGVASATRWASSGRHKIVQGAEIGGMFQMPRKPTDWPTYVPHNMDWQPGFASIEIERAPGLAGHFSISLASWQNNQLMWRGERW